MATTNPETRKGDYARAYAQLSAYVTLFINGDMHVPNGMNAHDVLAKHATDIAATLYGTEAEVPA